MENPGNLRKSRIQITILIRNVLCIKIFLIQTLTCTKIKLHVISRANRAQVCDVARLKAPEIN